jgi:hypothetical protein
MDAKLRISPLVTAFFFVLLTIGFSHSSYAQTDACGTTDPNTGSQMNGTDAGGNPTIINDPPGLINSGLGGWGGQNQFGVAQNVYQNTLQHTVTNRMNAKHQMVMNSLTMKAAMYCWTQLQKIYQEIRNSGASIWMIAIGVLIDQVIAQLITTICNEIIQEFQSLVQQVDQLVTNLMCVPMPRLQIPVIHIPGLPATSCNGLSLAKFSIVPRNSPNNISSNNLLWTLWKNELNLKVQQ